MADKGIIVVEEVQGITDAIVRNTETIPRQSRYLYYYWYSILWNTEKYRNKIPALDILE